MKHKKAKIAERRRKYKMKKAAREGGEAGGMAVQHPYNHGWCCWRACGCCAHNPLTAVPDETRKCKLTDTQEVGQAAKRTKRSVMHRV